MLFRRYARLVWSVAERIVRNKAEADDLLQDVFLLIQRRAAVFDSSKGTARSLIVHMTYQRALSRRRYLNARTFPGSDRSRRASRENPRSRLSVLRRIDRSAFWQGAAPEAISEMSGDQLETLRLYFIGGFTFEEIAAKLGQSTGNVKHHYYRGLQGLRRYLPKG